MDEISPLGHYTHRVLTVGNIPEQSRDVGPVLHGLGIEFTHVPTADQAAGAIEKTPAPFSLVICDQRLEGMKGTELLARVRKSAPETLRFLITRYSDMETIISAVNTGAVHRFISMPWDDEKMTETITWGLRHYEHHLESEKLFSLAKTQNRKLFDLNCELMETARHHDKESKALEREIIALKAAIKEKAVRRPFPAKKLAALIIHAVGNTSGDRAEMLNALYTQSMAGLHWAFSDFAMRNGIQMPEPEPGDSDD